MSPRVAVTTEQLLVMADGLQECSDTAHGRHGPLATEADATSQWSAGQAQQAASAFFDTLAWAAEGAAEGLADLGRRVAAAGGAYDTVERGLPFPR
ncbi:MAG: hypothetical protein ACRYF3_05770 [Janthinobacterium lividum]